MRAKRFLLIILLVALGLFFIFMTDFSSGRKPIWGVTFSHKYAEELELDWQETYLAILDDLKVSNIRLSAYWDDIEQEEGIYLFDNLDWRIEKASERGVKIILAVGRRLPRWPECHDPEWISDITTQQANQKVLTLVESVVNRYKDNVFIEAWQVENEPLFSWFGKCPDPNKDFLLEEVTLVKRLDPVREVLITDSGELSGWQEVADVGDVLGTTLYRVVWNDKLGFWDYWFVPPAFYRYKADITKYLHKNLSDVIIAELQMEPWTLGENMINLTKEEREKSFDLKRFKKNLRYAEKTGMPRVYLWGVEYWYWLDKIGEKAIWEEAKKVW